MRYTALLVALPVTLGADVRLPRIFSDGMVLQRDACVRLWGLGTPGEQVSVSGSCIVAPVTATVAADGRFEVELASKSAGGPHTLVVRGANTLEIADVWLGDVWLASGQSNMEMPIADTAPWYTGVDDWQAELARLGDPEVRFFDVPNVVSLTPLDDCEGTWRAATTETARNFSATALYFARALRRSIGVPIGIVSADWGGTPAEAWTSRATLATLPDYADAAAELERMAGVSKEAWALRAAERVADFWKRADELDRPVREAVLASAGLPPDAAQLDLPGGWTSGELADFDGLAWHVREVAVPAEWSGRGLVLELGPIDDMDHTFWNGEPIGTQSDRTHWNEPRRYAIDAALVRPGSNQLAVRVYDWGGGGGIGGEAAGCRLFPVDDEASQLSLAGSWSYRLSSRAQDLGAWPADSEVGAHTPSALFNGLIAPIAGYGLRGAIWYQGESNRTRAFQYRALLPAMVQDWRTHFRQGAFPFLFAQIAPFAYGGDRGEAAELREAQTYAETVIPHSAMVVTMDVGDPEDIHPRDKRTVGERLALAALSQAYGRERAWGPGPRFERHELGSGALRLFFRDVAGGLRSRDGAPLTCFTLAGPDRVFVAADARIVGDCIVVQSAAVADPLAVRFAWGAADEPNLCDAAGLPVPSFRSDDWGWITR